MTLLINGRNTLNLKQYEVAKKKTTKYEYVPTPEESRAMSICNDNRITIYPVPHGNSYELVVMRADGYKQQSKERYDSTKDNWYRKIFELYLILEKRL